MLAGILVGTQLAPVVQQVAHGHPGAHIGEVREVAASRWMAKAVNCLESEASWTKSPYRPSRTSPDSTVREVCDVEVEVEAVRSVEAKAISWSDTKSPNTRNPPATAGSARLELPRFRGRVSA